MSPLYPSVDSIRPGYRRSVCGVDNIFYRLSEDETVEIIAILGRQVYPERL
jgi:toxin ParE1/3/4